MIKLRIGKNRKYKGFRFTKTKDNYRGIFYLLDILRIYVSLNIKAYNFKREDLKK